VGSQHGSNGSELGHYLFRDTDRASGSEDGTTLTLTASSAIGRTNVGLCVVNSSADVDTHTFGTADYLGSTFDSPQLTLAGTNRLVLSFLLLANNTPAPTPTRPSGMSAAAGETSQFAAFSVFTEVAQIVDADGGTSGPYQWTTITEDGYARTALTVAIEPDGSSPLLQMLNYQR
jgi:hypothetical protein